MKDFVEALWNGELNPHVTYLRDDPAYHALLLKMTERQEAFINTLNKQQQNAFIMLMDDTDRIMGRASFLAFKKGFRLGASLMQTDVKDDGLAFRDGG